MSCHVCHIFFIKIRYNPVHILESFDDALKLLQRKRNVAPGIYNENRLYEAPVPQAGQRQAQPNVRRPSTSRGRARGRGRGQARGRARSTANTLDNTNTQVANESTGNQSIVDSTVQNATSITNESVDEASDSASVSTNMDAASLHAPRSVAEEEQSDLADETLANNIVVRSDIAVNPSASNDEGNSCFHFCTKS